MQGCESGKIKRWLHTQRAFHSRASPQGLPGVFEERHEAAANGAVDDGGQKPPLEVRVDEVHHLGAPRRGPLEGYAAPCVVVASHVPRNGGKLWVIYHATGPLCDHPVGKLHKRHTI